MWVGEGCGVGVMRAVWGLECTMRDGSGGGDTTRMGREALWEGLE
jgi:hypothetical protein